MEKFIPALFAAIGTLALLLGYILRRLFDANQADKSLIMSEYLAEVRLSRTASEHQIDAAKETSRAMCSLSAAIDQGTECQKLHNEQMREQHSAICEKITGVVPKKGKTK